MASSVQGPAVKGLNEKYCTDCGKIILAKAEICPNCGCRQMAAAVPQHHSVTADFTSDPIVGPMILLFVLNILWNGLGNLVVGDRRGWGYGFLNWVFFIVSIFTFGLPCIGFYAYCGYQGYCFLRQKHSRA